MPFITDQPSEKTVSVPTDTLDRLLQSQELNNLTLAKIDIEGAELLAFKGAVSLFSKQLPSVWIVEINDAVNNFGYHKQEVIDFLDFYGYNLYSYSADINEIKPISLQQQKGNNILAIANNAVNLVQERLNSYAHCID